MPVSRVRSPGWAVANVERLLDAWGGAEPGAVGGGALEAAPAAGQAATDAWMESLQVLLQLDPGEQRSTPLEVVRTLYREPTAVLAAAGVPDVVRDPFAERSWPEDRYGLVPRPSGTSAIRTSARCTSPGGWRRRRSCGPGPDACPPDRAKAKPLGTRAISPQGGPGRPR